MLLEVREVLMSILVKRTSTAYYSMRSNILQLDSGISNYKFQCQEGWETKEEAMFGMLD